LRSAEIAVVTLYGIIHTLGCVVDDSTAIIGTVVVIVTHNRDGHTRACGQVARLRVAQIGVGACLVGELARSYSYIVHTNIIGTQVVIVTSNIYTRASTSGLVTRLGSARSVTRAWYESVVTSRLTTVVITRVHCTSVVIIAINRVAFACTSCCITRLGVANI
jgi:hypothetical protein